MDSLKRTLTNSSGDKIDGGPLTSVLTDSSTTSVKQLAVPKSTARSASTHSLLAVNSGIDIRRGPHTEASRTATERANIMTTNSISKKLGPPVLSPPLPSSTSMEESQLIAGPPSSAPSPVENSKSEPVASNENKDSTSAGLALSNLSKPEGTADGVLPLRGSRVATPRSVSANRRLSATVTRQPSESKPLIGSIGVCALDVKARSRPSRQILTRLQGEGEFEVIVFGDKVILDEEVENWPICDFMISFFSDGFPLEKAIAYSKLRKPFLVNDLMMQKILWDRRLCLMILDQLRVPTPDRLEVTRDGGPVLESVDLAQQVRKFSGVVLSGSEDGTGGGVLPPKKIELLDDGDTLVVDGKVIMKPFVEKPVSGEDHNVIIYFSRSQEGGGARRLFRKVGNKSSEYDPELITPRCITEPDASYIYEQFLHVDNAEDVKAYTVGTNYCHAETRKSPVVDGLVRRNTHGKELRYVTKLNETEKQMAAKIARGFGQRICGFDLLRAGNQSYVIDVNGWSFVKDNEDYYNDCARILKSTFSEQKFENLEKAVEDASLSESPPEMSSRTSTTGHGHRSALKTILKSPSMSKLSAHIGHHSRHRESGNVSPKYSSTSTPLSSPPTIERVGRAPTLKPLEDGAALPSPMMTGTSTPSEATARQESVTDSKDAEAAPPMPSSKHSWKLKGVVTVIRHADRTPKQKIKFTAHSGVFVDLLKGHNEEVLLKGETALSSVQTAVKTAMDQKLEDPEKLRNLQNALARKVGQPDTKVQIKPMFRKRKPEEARSKSPAGVPPAIPEHHATDEVIESPRTERANLSPAIDGMPSPTGDEAARVVTRSDSMSGPTFSRFAAQENDLVLDKLQLVMKWGGEPTHSARYQSQDLGSSMRDDYKLLNRHVLDDVRIFTSSEKRVKISAQIWAAAFLGRSDISEDFIQVRKDLLDDSNAAKDVMDKVKKKLKHLLREGNSVPEQFAWPKNVPEPYHVMQNVIELLKFHRRVMRHNFKKVQGGAMASLAAIGNSSDSRDATGSFIDIASIQARWCTGEDGELFKERWEKLFSEFCDSEKADPSKVSELYDTMKYDALHNKPFLEWVFTPSQSIIEELQREEGVFSQSTSPEPERNDDSATNSQHRDSTTSFANNTAEKHSFAQKLGIRRRSVLTQPPVTPPLTGYEQDASYFKLFSGSGNSTAKQDKRLGRLRELYRYAKILFDYIGPQEYGISDDEKLEIGLLTSLPLLREIVQDLEELQASSNSASFIYFTKESHIYTLLNCIMEGGIHTKIKRATIPELDYLSQICFELYEAKDSETSATSYSIRMSISPGCHTIDPLDVSLDSKHAIGTAPRRSLTDHQDWKEVISALKAKFDTVQLPKSFLAVNVSEKHEQEARKASMSEENPTSDGPDLAAVDAPVVPL